MKKQTTTKEFILLEKLKIKAMLKTIVALKLQVQQLENIIKDLKFKSTINKAHDSLKDRGILK